MIRTFRQGTAVLMLVTATLGFAQDRKDTSAPTLRTLAARQNFLFGAATKRGNLNNPKSRETAAREFNSLTPENELKCAAIAAKEGNYYFTSPDYMVKWAEQNGMKVRGHTLIWHRSVPKWIAESGWNKEQTLAFLKEYITAVVTHYKGKLYAWDVVNEVIDDLGRFRGADSSFWGKTCGEDYIEPAFRWAHAADPDVKLFINDYGVETINAKSNATYELVKQLLARGVPIHGFGMQAHMTVGPNVDYKSIAANIKRFTDLGLEVQITELDVRIPGEATAEQLKQQAEMYGNFTRLALENPKVTNITVWGVSDADSWIPGAFPGWGTALLFDGDFNPKPAYAAVSQALAAGRPARRRK